MYFRLISHSCLVKTNFCKVHVHEHTWIPHVGPTWIMAAERWNSWNPLSVDVPTRDLDYCQQGGERDRYRVHKYVHLCSPMIAVNWLDPPPDAPTRSSSVSHTIVRLVILQHNLPPPRRNPPFNSTHRQPHITYFLRNINPPSIPLIKVLMAPLLTCYLSPSLTPPFST